MPESIEANAERVAAEAPPLTPEQRDRLRTLLLPTRDERGRAA